MEKIEFRPTEGLVGGLTIQLAEGCWPGTVGAGIAMNEPAFDRVEPLIKRVCDGWTSGHRFGVFELSLEERLRLGDLLRKAACNQSSADNEGIKALYSKLVDWLDERSFSDDAVSIFGI